MGFFASQGEAGRVVQYTRAKELLTDGWLSHIHAMTPIEKTLSSRQPLTIWVRLLSLVADERIGIVLGFPLEN